MAIVDNTISWVFVGDNPITGHWETSSGQEIRPNIGMTLDPALCDLHWKKALNTLGLDAMPVPGDVLYHVTSLKSAKRAPLRIRGIK